nr:bifunctional DNA primase/helicase [uncultured Bacteroides sp.]
MRNFHSYGIETRGRSSGKIKTICPFCNETRGHKGDKSLSVDLDTGLYYCHHCQAKGCVPDDAQQRAKEFQKTLRSHHSQLPSHFRRPTFDTARLTLSEKTEQYLVQTRCIPQEVIRRLQIGEQTETMPDSRQPEKCICFNYFENGTLINTKFRSAQKHFKMIQGAELIPYHVDGILDTPECIITEGELDAASFMAAGRDDVISVPAGAQSNLTWLDRFIATHFAEKKIIYIAADEDSAGQVLRQELTRRLGSERCRLVHFGPGCKDANEHLIRYGADSLLICLQQAEEIPIEGVFTADDLKDDLRSVYENGLKRGAETGWDNFDLYCTMELRRLMVVSGLPGDGKSEWVDELVMRLCLRHDWKVGYFSPENLPITYHLCKLAEKLTGLAFNPQTGMTEEIYRQASRFLTENVTHILPGNEDYTLDTVLEKARQLVILRGIRILVIDPLNRLDQRLPTGQTELQYISSLLNQLSRFAVRNQCLVILVAHPRKINRNQLNGVRRRVEMNDIAGSADFGNKSDFCVIVDREDDKGLVNIFIDKVKFKHLGNRGEVKFVYNRVNGRYSPCEEGIISGPEGDKQGPVNTQYDNTNWLKNYDSPNCLFN